MAIKIVFSTINDEDQARRIASQLVQEHLAACVNLLSGVQSLYRWEGRVTRDQEILMLIKTQASQLEALTRRLTELHPYDVPECIAVAVESGFQPYLDWVKTETSG